ncbi:hypothetical protein DV733_09380 [Halapricum salinum]|uniref:Uncharacterized protein n=2 Tax=Halapricum salinum TaxID=1457250 RepID=A0A4D6HCB2_9EURY|nr:hypothetical protein DV733_09380 [Halapricum salinum]
MPFKLSSDARRYFGQIQKNSTRGTFDTLWDQYYLSALVGIKARSRVPESEEPDEDPFMTEVIQDYDNQKYEIYGALIVAEIEREGIPWENEQEVQGLMLEMLDSTSVTRLSDRGATVLNCYAERGFKIIRSEIPAPPQLGEFLEQYYDLLLEVDQGY